MTLHLYDTATRSLRPFEPLEPGKASIYLCGATVQAPPHIGHIRSGVNFDILTRWLSHSGYDVTFLRNVTDIDDKILRKSAEAGRPWWAWAAQNEAAFTCTSVSPASNRTSIRREGYNSRTAPRSVVKCVRRARRALGMLNPNPVSKLAPGS